MSPEASVVQRSLLDGEGLTVRLTRYAPGLVQPDHAHGPASLSLVLAGRLRERGRGADCDLSGGTVGRKPEDWSHAVEFGPDGALILSVEGAQLSRPGDEPAWTRARPAAAQLLRLIIAGGSSELVEEAVLDLAAPGAALGRQDIRAPWLAAARERLLEEPESASINDLARAGGVHRSHFARAFEAAFGVAPSVFRRRIMVDRALRSLLFEGEPAARAAQAGGFFDQSHFSRAVAAQCGAAPGQLLRLLSATGRNIGARKPRRQASRSRPTPQR
jgi:AraC-like DNA-binding protein